MWISGNYGVELNITKNDAYTGSHAGDCLEDIRGLLEKPYIKRQLKRIDPEMIKKELADCGAWSDEELENAQENQERLLWVFCGNLVDELYERESRP